MFPWFQRAPDGVVTLLVHAQPGAKRTEISGVHGDALKIRVAAPANEGRANEAIAQYLAGRFGVARRAVRLMKGEKSRAKRFEVRGGAMTPERLLGES